MNVWLELKTELPREQVDAAEELLLGLGALSITNLDARDQPILEPGPGETPLWDAVVVVGLFAGGEIDADDLRAAFANAWAAGYDANPPGFRVEHLADREWERVWLEHFRPMRFGERLWVVPSWTAPPVTKEAGAVNLRLDPGLAFGTGTHQTTALCLRWLDSLPLQNKSVLDFGCGSGILGIAAGLLGARTVTGVDNDPQAILATRENAQRNGVAVDALLPMQFAAHNAQFDVIVANILAGPLVQLAPQIAARLAPGGAIALSGILRDQADEVAAAYTGWIDWAPAAIDGDWVRLAGIRHAP